MPLIIQLWPEQLWPEQLWPEQLWRQEPWAQSKFAQLVTWGHLPDLGWPPRCGTDRAPITSRQA